MTLLRLSLALLLILATPALAGPPPPGARFDIQLQAPMAFSAPLEAIELDPDEVSAAKVADLNRRGIYTICYVSVGTAEEWRADFDQFPPEVLGREYDDWPGEFFLDARRTDLLLPLMEARFQRCRAMGFDAIEADNIDLPGQASGFPLSRRDVVAYVSKLAQSA
ncbi:MAG: endo alpha-1,4 polygalactosaminidase, partial [Maritimibacter sp.]